MGLDPSQIKICAWNVRGLTASIPCLRDLCKENDFMLISEHWLHDNKLSDLDEISTDLQWHARASKYSNSDNFGLRRGQGGVAILWKSCIRGVTPLKEIIHDRICGVRLQNSLGTIINIFCVYLPTQGGYDDLQTVTDEMAAILEGTEEGCVNIIGGDFNCDIGSEGGPRGNRAPTRAGSILLQFMNRYHLLALNMTASVTGPVDTFDGSNGRSCIDYVLIPSDLIDNIKVCRVDDSLPLNTSDHFPVILAVDVGDVIRVLKRVKNMGKVRWDKLSRQDLYDRYTNPVSDALYRIFDEFNQLHPNEDNLNNLVGRIVSTMRSYEKVIPVSRYRKNVKPFWCAELDILKRHKVSCFREWCLAGRPRERDNQLWINNNLAKKRFIGCLRHLKRQYEDDKIREASSAADIDKNTFWRLLKRERGGIANIAKSSPQYPGSASDISAILIFNVEYALMI